MKKPKPIKRKRRVYRLDPLAPIINKRKRGATSVPCPKCGSPSTVCRTTRGERLRTSRRKRNYVLRERRCISPAKHKFSTEEHTR